ncbi:YqcI/YcgG family protein [Oceanobacillus kapialis]|uniref:YqcI/YcgG family protein n=1 Tax=Oceanobacillus kapialis TaxID=481353 RepID=UPI00385077DE
MDTILDKQWLDNNLKKLPRWQQEVYTSFSSMLTHRNTYPCVPARVGFLANELRFRFLGDPRETITAENLATTLKTYGEISRDTGKYASLAIFFHTPEEMVSAYNVEDYREVFWKLINEVTIYDETEWPSNIPEDPHHHKWEFCFDGEPFFAFCATPAHKRRKSRYQPCFFIAFQPRWVFEEMNGNTPFGQKIKKAIRHRLAAYDEVAPHPDLNWYGEANNHEWKQYFLSDEQDSPTTCPFTRVKNTFSSLLK